MDTETRLWSNEMLHKVGGLSCQGLKGGAVALHRPNDPPSLLAPRFRVIGEYEHWELLLNMALDKRSDEPPKKGTDRRYRRNAGTKRPEQIPASGTKW